MCRRVRLSASVFAVDPGSIDALALALTPILEIVTSDLQGEFQQHLLHRLEDDLRDPLSVGCDIAQIDNTGHGKPCALRADCGNELFGLWQRQAAYAVDLLRNDNLAG
ncbi:hypothetical protein [Rhizobium mongolense]|uniref:hypothetical protein n=1 Tax=Rhizobium mongolense TaxID=57676 RepID=UPI003F5E6A90